MRGFPSTVGCASRVNKISIDNGMCVKVLENAGAIVIVRGNIP
jgi:Asp-tRNA(Asn)/Glu-tRNA(Gln) amidotransferase A subunit family amidase